MIDFRHETFFHLCRLGSYTKTAEYLNMTQPAVSQHIRHLEQLYGGPLLVYQDKTLSLTPRGERLSGYVKTMLADITRVRDELQHLSDAPLPVSFGATLTIGEYVMPPILEEMMGRAPACRLSMTVDNTEILLQKLQGGMIDFALLEGYFDKSGYGYQRLGDEEFIPICSVASPLAGQTVALEDLTGERLILREKGSGTREILEHGLKERNYTVDSFGQVYEIGNMSAIKQLVARNLGISFMYAAAAKQELQTGVLATFQIHGFAPAHEFNFVFLKNSMFEAAYLYWFRQIHEGYGRRH